MGDLILLDQCCKKFACVVVPQLCPWCSKTLNKINPPVVHESPFSEHCPDLAILLKPTDGIWYEDCDFHVGLSLGSLVTSYNELGIIQENYSKSWRFSIVIYCVSKKYKMLLENLWVATRDSIQYDNEWTKTLYNLDTHNCMDFVVCFLRRMQEILRKRYNINSKKELEIFQTEITKNNLVKKDIAQKVQAAYKYIELMNAVTKRQYIDYDLLI